MSVTPHRALRRAALASIAATAAVAALLPAAPADAAVTPLQDLRTRVLRALAGSTAYHVTLRADVEGIGVISTRSAAPMPPASTEKLLTSITALQRVGAQTRFKTSVVGNAPVLGGLVGGVLRGDLAIRTSGDPTLRRADLDALADQVRAAGVRTVTGALVIDAGRLANDTVAPGWKPGFVPWESGPVSAFVVDRNTWRTDSTYVANPALGNAQLWRAILAHRGIGVLGHTAFRSAGTPTRLFGTHESPTLGSIIRPMLKESDNFLGEMLLRQSGAAVTGFGSRRSGAGTVYLTADHFGVARGSVYDGSGLSYSDRQTPDQLVGWLKAVARTRDASTLRSALPVSCVDGTLYNRLCGWGLTGRVQAKTGTLDGVRTLAGYTTTLKGRRVTFAVMLSGIRDMTAARRHMDSAIARLALYTG